MKKALIITTVSGFVPQFEMNNVKILQSMGFQIHYAANYYNPVYGEDNSRLEHTGIIKKQVNFVREPWKLLSHWRAYAQLKKLMEHEEYQLVHCHTPMGGVIGRLAAKSARIKTVIYTVHGFHFYKGSSIGSWVVIYLTERFLAKYTDVLVTINQEDYKVAKRFTLRKYGKIENIKGIGIDTERYPVLVGKEEKYKELGVSKNSFIITSVGELSNRKNHKVIVKALAMSRFKNITYLICGKGPEEENLKRIVKKYGLDNQVVFCGYRSDVDEILSITDIFVFPSKQEGLPVALLEAMTVGLPVVCSQIRGNVDLVVQGKGGYLVKEDDYKGFTKAIEMLYLDSIKRYKFGNYNRLVVKKFDKKKVEKVMRNVYQSCVQSFEETLC